MREEAASHPTLAPREAESPPPRGLPGHQEGREDAVRE